MGGWEGSGLHPGTQSRQQSPRACELATQGQGRGDCSPAQETLTPDVEVVVFLRAACLVQRLTGVAACIPHLCPVHLANSDRSHQQGQHTDGVPGADCVTVGRPLYLAVPQPPHLEPGTSRTPKFPEAAACGGLLWVPKWQPSPVLTEQPRGEGGG